MQAMLVGAGHFTAPTIYTFDRDMVAFILFFGVPLAFTASRLMRATMIAELRIDLGAIVRNVDALAELVAPARLVPVIKSNAYGHGLIEVARALDGRVDALGGLRTRRSARAARSRHHVADPRAGTDSGRRALGDAHAAGVEITLWDGGAYLDDVASAAHDGGSPFRVHAKIDTGVARLGMRVAEAPALPAPLRSRTRRSISRRVLAPRGGRRTRLDVHARTARRVRAPRRADLRPTSNGTSPQRPPRCCGPKRGSTAVRAGIGIYGLWPSPETERIMRDRGFTLEPALSMAHANSCSCTTFPRTRRSVTAARITRSVRRASACCRSVTPKAYRATPASAVTC